MNVRFDDGCVRRFKPWIEWFTPHRATEQLLHSSMRGCLRHWLALAASSSSRARSRRRHTADRKGIQLFPMCSTSCGLESDAHLCRTWFRCSARCFCCVRHVWCTRRHTIAGYAGRCSIKSRWVCTWRYVPIRRSVGSMFSRAIEDWALNAASSTRGTIRRPLQMPLASLRRHAQIHPQSSRVHQIQPRQALARRRRSK